MTDLHGQRSLVISKVDEKRRLAIGWAYIASTPDGGVVVYNTGDVVDDPVELEKAAYRFVRDARRGGEMHQTQDGVPIQVADMVESFVTTPDKIMKMGIDPNGVPVGWWVGWKVNDNKVWDKVMDGTYGSFSIHGKGRRHSD